MSLFDWIDIPVIDIERAATFYGALLETRLEIVELVATHRAAFLPVGQGESLGFGVALMEAEAFAPSGYRGCRLYFRALPDMDAFLVRVEEAGGRIEMPRTITGPQNAQACLAYFFDTEGNLMGAHAPA